ncbi:unnamed protein product [Rotaria sp. Silwood1]|nr:unnamed protein product [Rotaria sp. Silwood1]CAF4781096.1 unnamed protein product [Rotaria sp. Silwood1]
MNSTKRHMIDSQSIHKQAKKLRTIFDKSITCIENLPNEIFYEIFTYLEGCKLYEAFTNLNTRFQHLLTSSYVLLNIQISSCPETILERRCTHIIKPNKHQIVSISLLNYCGNDEMFTLFAIDSSFTQLESLVLKNIDENKIIKILSNLISLFRLFFLTIYLNDNCQDLCKLIKFTRMPIASNKQYSSIEYMNIGHRCTINQIISLLSYTPRLSHLTCEELFELQHRIPIQIPITLSNLTHISIGFCKIRFAHFEIFLQKFCAQIKFLRIMTSNYFAYLDIDRWERLIQDYMPHLCQFYFQYYQIIDHWFLFAPYRWLMNRSTSLFWTSRRCIFECHLDIDSRSHGQIIYSLRFSKNKMSTSNRCIINQTDLYDSAIITNGKYVAKSSQLTVSCLDFTQCNIILVEKIRAFLLTVHFNHLNINCKWVPISTLIKLIWYLPNLHSLHVSNLTILAIKSLSIDDLENFRLASKENKIIEVHLAQMIEFKQAQFLIDLCPGMQHFTVECLNGVNIEMVVQFLLIDNCTKFSNLCILCLYGSICNFETIENFKIMINREQQLHDYTVTSKISPVFNRMLYSNGFRESKTSEIILPGKQYLHIIELLKCIYPNILKSIDNSNAMYLLPLSDEYSIVILKKNIERYFISTINSISYKYGDNLTRLFDLLSLSQLYRLNKLEENICEQLTNHFDIEQWNKIDLSIDLRCHLLELYAKKQQMKLKEKQNKLNQLEDLCLKQKFEIQRLKSQLEVNQQQ